MPLPHTSVDKLHESAVEICMSYERACRRRGVKLDKLTITYEPDGEGFGMKIDEHPYPKKDGKIIIPEEEKLVAGEDSPVLSEWGKDDNDRE